MDKREFQRAVRKRLGDKLNLADPTSLESMSFFYEMAIPKGTSLASAKGRGYVALFASIYSAGASATEYKVLQAVRQLRI